MSSFGRISPLKSFHKGPLVGRLQRNPNGMPSAQDMARRSISREAEQWWLLDAKGLQVREVAKIATYYLFGQHRPDFNPRILTADQVIVINVKDAVMVGDTWMRYPIDWTTNYPRKHYSVRASEMYERDPCMLLWNFVREEVTFPMKNAVTRPKAYLMSKNRLEFLWLYEDALHPHIDQSPRPILWAGETRPFYYKNKHLQRRWFINQFTQ